MMEVVARIRIHAQTFGTKQVNKGQIEIMKLTFRAFNSPSHTPLVAIPGCYCHNLNFIANSTKKLVHVHTENWIASEQKT